MSTNVRSSSSLRWVEQITSLQVSQLWYKNSNEHNGEMLSKPVLQVRLFFLFFFAAGGGGGGGKLSSNGFRFSRFLPDDTAPDG